jgi:hypothetical protein
MSASIELFDNTVYNEGTYFYGQDESYHPTLERFTMLNCEILLAKENVPPRGARVRNQNATYALNFHSTLYDKNQFPILKGTYAMFGYNPHTEKILTHEQLMVIAQELEFQKETAIMNGVYALDITIEDGLAIKRNMH